MLRVVDEFTREALAIRVARRLSSTDVIDVLADLFVARGVPAHVRSDQGPEFVAEGVKGWIAGVGAATAFIERASPWENGYVESFNGKLRDELLRAEVFDSLREAQVLVEPWRQHYNTARPHSALGYRPPAPEVVVPDTPMPPGRPGPVGSAQPLTAALHENSARTTPWGLVRARVALRSRTPAPVRREVRGLLLAHFAVRGLVHEAAPRADEDPDRLSLPHAV